MVDGTPEWSVRSAGGTFEKQPDDWIGGTKYARAIQQFQLLYELYGGLALEFTDFILWPDDRRPERKHYLDWAAQYDTGQARIEEPVREAFTRRLGAFNRGVASANLHAMGKLIRKIAAQLDAELDKADFDLKRINGLKELSGFFQHAAVNSSFHLKELEARKDSPQMQVNMGNVRFITNRPPPRHGRKLKGMSQLAEPVIEGVFEEVS